MFLIGNISAEPWHSPDGRLPAFIIGAVILFAGGIDAAFAQTEDAYRPAMWLTLMFALMAFITARAATPMAWYLSGYHSYYAVTRHMDPAVIVGDTVVVDFRAYRYRSPERGDIVAANLQINAYQKFPHLLRVIAIPGDTIQGTNGHITLNNIAIRESYVAASDVTIDVSSSTDEELKKRYTFGPVKLGAGEYFLMGDNRDESNDSRQFGPVKLADILGKALYIRSNDDSRDGKRLD